MSRAARSDRAGRRPCPGAGSPARRSSRRRAASEPRAPSASRRGTGCPGMRVELGRARSGTSSGRSGERGSAHQGRVPVDGDRPQLLQQGGTAAEPPRTWNESVDSSYSRIDPPSVLSVMSPKPRLVSRTAFLTMRSRTSSRSRLEPTASSTSRRASSCATLSRQLGASGLEGAHQVDLPQHDRALSGELLEELAFVVVEGRRRRCATSTARRRPRPAASSAWRAGCGSR